MAWMSLLRYREKKNYLIRRNQCGFVISALFIDRLHNKIYSYGKVTKLDVQVSRLSWNSIIGGCTEYYYCLGC